MKNTRTRLPNQSSGMFSRIVSPFKVAKQGDDSTSVRTAAAVSRVWAAGARCLFLETNCGENLPWSRALVGPLGVDQPKMTTHLRDECGLPKRHPQAARIPAQPVLWASLRIPLLLPARH